MSLTGTVVCPLSDRGSFISLRVQNKSLPSSVQKVTPEICTVALECNFFEVNRDRRVKNRMKNEGKEKTKGTIWGYSN